MGERKVHALRCDAEPFEDLKLGWKTFEYRRDDRGFAEGHILHLMKQDGARELTGEYQDVCVKYLLRGPAYSIPENYVIMSVVPLTEAMRPRSD